MQPVKRANSPYWYVRVQRNGRQFWRSTKETNLNRARERARVILNEVTDQAYGLAAPAADLWFADWWATYWTGQAGASATKAGSNTERIRRHLGKHRLRDLKPAHFQHYIQQRQREGAAPSTVCVEGRLIKQTLKAAILNGLLTQNPAAQSAALRWPKMETRDRVLDLEDEEPFLLRQLRADDPSMAEQVVLALHSGVRASELLHLRLEHIDLERRTMRVFGKYAKWREVPLFTRALAVLTTVVATRGTRGYAFPEHDVEREGRTPQAPIVAVNKRIARAWTDVGLPGKAVTTHCFRHTFATRYLLAGGDIYVLSKVLGHSSVVITEKVYAHLITADLVRRALQVTLPEVPVARLVAGQQGSTGEAG